MSFTALVCIYIELKTKNGRLNLNQKEWMEAVRREGYYAAVCYGIDEAVKLLTWYLSK